MSQLSRLIPKILSTSSAVVHPVEDEMKWNKKKNPDKMVISSTTNVITSCITFCADVTSVEKF